MDNSNLGGFLAAHYRAVMWGSAVVVLLCVIAIIVAAVSQIKPARTFVEIAVVPTTATVVINSKEYRNGVYEMAPGNYTASVSQDGFDATQTPVKAEAGKTTRLEVVLLKQKEGMYYIERSESDLKMMATLSDAGDQEFMEQYNQKVSIRQELPMEIVYEVAGEVRGDASTYGVETLADGSGDPRCVFAFCLIATGYELNLNALREAVEDKGYNLDDYEVVYDFEV